MVSLRRKWLAYVVPCSLLRAMRHGIVTAAANREIIADLKSAKKMLDKTCISGV